MAANGAQYENQEQEGEEQEAEEEGDEDEEKQGHIDLNELSENDRMMLMQYLKQEYQKNPD